MSFKTVAEANMAEEEAKREADKKLRAKVRAEIAAALRDFVPNYNDTALEVCGAIADALMTGKIRHMKVTI